MEMMNDENGLQATAAVPSRPAWGTAPIRCGKTKCKWRGYETDLAQVPHKKFSFATQSVCPTCGCDSYMHMTEREIAAHDRARDRCMGTREGCRPMTRLLGFAMWLLAVLAFWVLPPAYLHLYPPKPMQCPPECTRCGHSWGPSNEQWCTPKNTGGTK